MRAWLLMAVLLCCWPAAGGAVTLERGEVAGWYAGAFSDDKSGRFDHCGVLLNYSGGRSLGITIGPKAWAMGVADPSWALSPAQRYPIAYAVDGSTRLSTQATATQPNLLTFDLPNSAELFELLKTGKVLHVLTASGTTDFLLSRSAAALADMVACVRRYAPASYPDSAPSNPFRAVATPIPAQPTTRPTARPSAPSSEADVRTEASTALSNLFSRAGIRGFEIRQWDSAMTGPSPVWSVGDVMGLLTIIPPQQGSFENAAAGLSAFDAYSCKGKFAFGKLAAPIGARIVHVFSVCDTGDTMVRLLYLAFPRQAGGYYLLSTVVFRGKEAEAEALDARLVQTLSPHLQ
jgi:hypothetical protein